MLFIAVDAAFPNRSEGVRLLQSCIFLPSGTNPAFFTLCLTLPFPFGLSADSKAEEPQVSSENLRESLKKELEFYFSR